MSESLVGTLRWNAEMGKGMEERTSWAVSSDSTRTTMKIRAVDGLPIAAHALGELADLLIANRLKVTRPGSLVPVRHGDACLASGNHLPRYYP
jgi:hypothetical protein